MCGIIGAVTHTPVNQLLYDGLLLLQHRGQDAAGIVTSEGPVFHMYKGAGYVRDVFRTRNMRDLLGTSGIGHCRYPTAGSAYSDHESQPFYVNSPFGVTLSHNGNLTNSEALKQELFQLDFRHVNTNSDSEVLLNVLALELERAAHHARLDANAIFTAVAGVHRRCRGAYAIVAMIAGYGLLAFRDPFGIRPLIIGVNEAMGGAEYVVASESVALEALGFSVLRDVAPGEAIYVDQAGRFHSRQCADEPRLSPCIFEFVYLARPDSVMDGTSVYEARLRMGGELAKKIAGIPAAQDIDVVIPIPDSSRPVRYPNVYGIDMPNQRELIATGRSEAEIAHEIGADLLIYQDLAALKSAVRAANPRIRDFEASCFDGYYVTGDITADYLSHLAAERDEARGEGDGDFALESRAVAG